jgi:hypothetical protein
VATGKFNLRSIEDTQQYVHDQLIAEAKKKGWDVRLRIRWLGHHGLPTTWLERLWWPRHHGEFNLRYQVITTHKHRSGEEYDVFRPTRSICRHCWSVPGTYGGGVHIPERYEGWD